MSTDRLTGRRHAQAEHNDDLLDGAVVGSRLLRLRLLGDFSLRCNDQIIGVSATRIQSLLAYLALHRDAATTRQQLAFMFWPESSEMQARNNLRQVVHQLRRMWPAVDDWMSIEANRLVWRRAVGFDLDVDVFEEALARAGRAERAGDASVLGAALARAVESYRGELLPGCYDDWIVADRERLSQAFVRALARLIGGLEEQRQVAAAIGYAQLLLRHDPLDEAAYRSLMRLHALNHDRVSALRVYHACASVLERELAVEPSPATRREYEALLSVESRPVAAFTGDPTFIGTTPLIGRGQELHLLQSTWRDACKAVRRLVVVSGEAGIGKSRLTEELLTWASREGVSVARTRAYAAEGRLSFAPVADWLRSGSLRAGVSRLDAVSLTDVARLLPELLTRPDVVEATALNEYWERQRFFLSLARAVLSTHQPLLLLLDDLQWCDQETVEWLHYLLRFDPAAALLVVGTMRPEEVGQRHPLNTLLMELRSAGQLTEIKLGPLGPAETTELGMRVAGRALEPDEAVRLFEETEGQPLFVVEGVRAGLAGTGGPDATGDQVSRVDGVIGASTSPSRLPPRVHAVIAARLASLSDSARATVGLAATIGRAFSLDVLIQACDGDLDTLAVALDELWQRGIIREHGSMGYEFSHDKIREVAYNSLSAARRVLLHRRVARALESASRLDLDAVSAQVAAHYEHAGLFGQAVPYLQRAAGLAQRVFANAEAVLLLHRALALVGSLPNTRERDAQELALQTALGVSLVATTGYGSAETLRAYRRSAALCRELARQPSPPVLRGLALASMAHAEFDQAGAFGDQLISLANEHHDQMLEVEGHYVVGVSLFWKGAFVSSREHLEQALAHSGSDHLVDHLRSFAQDPRVVCLIRLAVDLWLLGFADEAQQKMTDAMRQAYELRHPFSLAYAMNWAMNLATLRRDVRFVAEQAETCLAQSREHDMDMWLMEAMVLQGWATAVQGDVEQGIAEMRRGMAGLRVTGNRFITTFFLGLLAEQYGRIGRLDRALSLVSRALTEVERTGGRWYEAELYRCRGTLALARQDAVAAEVAFERALAIACSQSAKAIELRVATAFAQLRVRQARYAEGCQVLEATCPWFADSAATPDLLDARSVLSACRAQLA